MESTTTPAAEVLESEAVVAPKLGVALDLASYSSFVPAFWPGQKISGRLRIEPHAPIDVIHFRVVLYGTSRVHGSGPDRPLTNGIFNYHKNTQLINSGIRVVPRTTVPPSTPTSPTASISGGDSRPHRSRSVVSSYERDMTTPTMCEQIQRKKSELDREIESMIRKYASETDHAVVGLPSLYSSNNIADDVDRQQRLISLLSQENESQRSFYLSPKDHQVRFAIRIPTTRQLPGSFDHAHFPIEYRIVAILLCTDVATGTVLTAHATAPLRIESYVNVQSAAYASPLRSSTRLWAGSPSFWTRLCQGNRRRIVYEDESGIPCEVNGEINDTQPRHARATPDSQLVSCDTSHLSGTIKTTEQRQKGVGWTGRMFQSGLASWLPLGGGSYAKAFDCTVELPRQAVQRGEPMPISIHLINGANIPIAYIVIKLEIVRRILMTCNVGEVLDTALVHETKATFFGEEHERDPNAAYQSDTSLHFSSQQPSPSDASSAFSAREICFDLSTLPPLPEQIHCSITTEATKDTFEIVHDLIATCKVFESKTKRPSQPNDSSHAGRAPTTLYAKRYSPPPQTKLPDACHIHVLNPSPIPIVIGSVSCDETGAPAHAML